MKIRNGFVSNSSSSSFIVQFNSTGFDSSDDVLASDKQVSALLNYGFKPTIATCPEQIEWNESWEDDSEGNYHLGLSVACNEHDVIEFLISNSIPFKALTHYGHYSEIWDGKGKIKRIRNLGLEISMYGHLCEDEDLEPIREEFTKEEWLKRFGSNTIRST